MHLLPLLSSLCSLLPQDTLALAHGPSADRLRIVTVDETRPAAAPVEVLADVELVSLALAARTGREILRPDRPRERSLPGGVVRVELPSGAAVHKYRRSGKTVFGFLLVTPSGKPVVLAERTGTGAGSLTDPFRPLAGMATDGSFAAVATATEVLLLRLDGGSFPSTGVPARSLFPTPVPADHESFVLGPNTFFFQANGGLFRCATADRAVPEEIPLGASRPKELKEEMAISGDGSTIAFLFGPDRDLLTVGVLRATGGAVAVSPRPGHYEEPDYLPAFTQGPRMVLTEDGSRLAYVEGQNREEIFLVPTIGTPVVKHVNVPALFDPYVDTGVFFSFVGPVFSMAFGQTANATDLYAVRDAGSTFSVTNVTVTSGIRVPPFGGNALLDLVRSLDAPGGTSVLVHRDAAGSLLLGADPVSGATTWLGSGGTGVPVPEPAGPGLFPDLILASAAGDRLLLPAAAGYAPAFTLPAGMTLRHSARRASDGWRLLSAEVLPGSEVTLAVRWPSLAIPLRFSGPTQAVLWTPSGGALFTEPSAAGTVADHYAPQGTVTRLAVQDTVVLPLNGAAR